MKIINNESGGFLKRFIFIILIVVVITFALAIIDSGVDGDSQVAGDCEDNPNREGC